MEKKSTLIKSSSFAMISNGTDMKTYIAGIPKFISSMANPNVKSIIRAIAAYLSVQISTDPSDGESLLANMDLFIFSEEKYISENPEAFDQEQIEYLRTPPTKELILEFIYALYDSAKLR